MGTVNVIKGLDTQRETHFFNGSIRENLDLNWEYVKIFSGDDIGHKKLTPDYAVQAADIIFIQEYPGIAETALIVGLVSLVAAGITGGIAIYKAKQAEKDAKRALDRVNKKSNKAENDTLPGLSGARNEKITGKQAPIIIGRHLFAPYYLSEPYLRPEGEDGKDLYWYATFLCGQTGLSFETIRNSAVELVPKENFDNRETIGSFPFGDIGEPETIPGTPDVTWGGGMTVAKFVNDFLPSGGVAEKTVYIYYGGSYGNWDLFSFHVTRDQYKGEWTVKFDTSDGIKALTASALEGTQGQIIIYPVTIDGRPETTESGGENKIHIIQNGYFSDGNNIVALKADKKELEIFDQKWVDSLESSVELGRRQKDNAETVDTIFIADDGEAPVIRESARFPLRIEAEILVDGLAGFDSKNDEMVDATVEIKMEWSTDPNSDAWRLIPILPMNRYDWQSSPNNPDTQQLTRKTTKQMRFIAAIDFSDYANSVYSNEGSPVYIRATRMNKMHASGWRDRVYLTAIRTQQYNPKESSKDTLVPARNIHPRLADKFCRMGVKIKVNRNTEESLDRFNIVASSTARTWNQTTRQWSSKTAKTKTSNPAALALEVLTGLIHTPSEYTDSEIDMTSFTDLYKYCEKQTVKIEGAEKEFKLEANGVITSAAKKLDLVKSILSTCDAGLYVNEYGILVAYYDDRQVTPIGLLNPQRIVSMSETRNLDRKTDGYKVEFTDEDADWSNDTRRILRPRIAELPGENTFTTLKLEYTTNYYQAMWHARRMMAKEINRPGEITVKVGKEGRYYRPGSLIKVQHEGFKHGVGSGEVVNVIYNQNKTLVTGFRLMEYFDISKDRDYFIDYFIVRPTEEPYVVTRQIQSVGTYTNELTLAVPLPADSPDVPEFGTIVSAIDNERGGTVQVRESKRYIVTGCSETSQGYDLSLAAYSEVIYDTTEIDEIPPYVSSIISSNPRVFEEPETRPYDGRDGLTPHIGDNKNWFIGKEDTGVKAEGKDGKAGTNAPRFLGAFSTPPSSLTSPLIGQFTASHEDYFIYTGNTTPNWTQNRIYQWDATQNRWNMLAVPTAANRGTATKYWEALPQLTAGTMEQVISIAFINSLIANEAFIKTLFSQYITILANGYIQSDTSTNGLRDFIIRANGSAEFNNATIRGNSVFGGMVLIGDVWDRNGNVSNPNGQGLLASPVGLGTQASRIRIKELYGYGTMYFGLPLQGGLTLEPGNYFDKVVCYTIRENYQHSRNGYFLRLSGNYTAAQLYSAINAHLTNEPVSSSYFYPITGSVNYSAVSGGGTSGAYTESRHVTVSCIEKTNTGYTIHGIAGNAQSETRVTASSINPSYNNSVLADFMFV